jgi:hypothetical protein
MKLTSILLLILSFVFFSCGDKADQNTKTPQWVLSSKKFYNYSLTPTGKVDTTFILHMNYNKADKSDSVAFFIKSLYKDNRLVEKKSYKKNGNTPEYMGNFTFEYDKAGRMIRSSVYDKNILSKQESYTYDTSGRLLMYSGILSRNTETMPDTEEDDITTVSSSSHTAYDTIYVKYEYDNTNRVVRSVATDNSGKIIRTDINVYSAAMPLAAYSINANGDTAQKMTFQPEGKFVKTVTTNDSLVLTRIVANGSLPLAQVTENKKTKKMYRRVYTYGNNGMSEMSFYILE